MSEENLPTSQITENRIEQGEDLAIDALLHSVYSAQLNVVNIRPKIQHKPTRQSYLSGWSALAAVLVVLCVIGYFIYPQFLPTPRNLTVVSVTGSAEYGQEAATKTARIGDIISVGEMLMTGADSSLELSYPDGTSVYLGSKSILTNAESVGSSKSKSLTLDAGNLKISAVKQEEGSPLYVSSPYAIMEVVGTIFNVNLRNGFTELSVDEGQVDIQRPDGTKLLQVQEKQIARMGPNISTVETNDLSGKPVITGFTLIATSTGEVVPKYDHITKEATLALSDLPRGGVNIRVNTKGEIKHLLIKDSGANKKTRIEKIAPYSIGYDQVHINGRYGRVSLKPGSRKITVTPFDQSEQAGEPVTLNLQIVK